MVVHMSYSELVKELKLENRLMAVTRVHTKDEQVNDIFGCVYKRFERVLNGETLVLKEGSCSCGGFDHNSGLNDEQPMIPGGFGVFLSHGSDQQWTPPGEKFKCDPATAEAMFAQLPKDVMDGFDAIKFEPYREGMKPDLVVAFVDPDQLSGMLVLHGYNKAAYDAAIATTVSGCASMLRIPFAEMKKEQPRAVITGTDLAQRHFMDENLVALSIAGWEFDHILDITEECYFHSPVFKKIRLRIHKDDAVPEKKFTSLA